MEAVWWNPPGPNEALELATFGAPAKFPDGIRLKLPEAKFGPYTGKPPATGPAPPNPPNDPKPAFSAACCWANSCCWSANCCWYRLSEGDTKRKRWELAIVELEKDRD